MSKCWKCGSCQECSQEETCKCADNKKLYGANTMKFGKYKGMTIQDVREADASYLMWLYTNVPKHKIEKDLYSYIRYNAEDIGKESTKQKRKTGWAE